MRPLGLFCILVLLSGCPKRVTEPQPSTPDTPAPTEDKFDRFGQVIESEDAFYAELKRLQGLHTNTPSFSGIPLGNAQQQYLLSSKIEDERVGFGILDNQSGEEWVLWGWHRDGGDLAEVEVIKDAPTSNGYTIELSFLRNSLNLRLVARWEQNRFLLVSRELMLGGLDHEWRVPQSCSVWQVAGRWLPYRMVPDSQGPYGVLRDAEADGNWHSRTYPETAMVPAVAAFDRYHGVMLGVVDEHPRKLDRTYNMSWKVATDYAYDSVISLNHQQYDSINETFNEPYIVSGLPYRDSIVLEIFDINSTSIDPTLVEAETVEVIDHLAALTRAYHFVPDPASMTSQAGCVVELSDWVGEDESKVKFIHKINDHWNVVGSWFDIDDVVTQPAGDSESVAPSRTAGLDEWESEELAGYVSASSIMGTLPGGETYPPWPDLRVAGAGTTLSRGLAEGVGKSAGTHGIAFDNPIETVQPGTGEPAQIRFCSNYVAAAVTTAYVAEQLAIAERPSLVTGSPALGVPVVDGAYRFVNPVFGRSADGAADLSMVIPSNSMASYAARSVFGVRPLVDCADGGLAEQVISTTPYVSGLVIGKKLEMYYGFEEFVEHQPELRKSAGQLQVIHSEPESSGYLSGGERPAECTELVAVMPGDLQSTAVWIAFFGTGGSVTVDEYNFVTVNWGDFGYWRDKLPVGYWVVMHPDPENIVAGDAVLIIRSPVTPGSSPNTNQG